MLFNLSLVQLIFICAIIIIALWLCYHNIGKLHKLYLELENRFSKQNNKIDNMEELYTNLSQTILKKVEEEEQEFLNKTEHQSDDAVENQILNSLDNFIKNDESKDLLASLIENDKESVASIHDMTEPQPQSDEEEYIQNMLNDSEKKIEEIVMDSKVVELNEDDMKAIIEDTNVSVNENAETESIEIEEVSSPVKKIKVSSKKDNSKKSKAKVIKETSEIEEEVNVEIPVEETVVDVVEEPSDVVKHEVENPKKGSTKKTEKTEKADKSKGKKNSKKLQEVNVKSFEDLEALVNDAE